MNNFDQSSTGVNLELHCFYDSCVARQEFEEAFKIANHAVNYGKWGDLFDIADKYDIDIADYEPVNKSIKEDIERIKADLGKHKSTYGWQLFECETEKCKQNVVKAFLKHLFNI